MSHKVIVELSDRQEKYLRKIANAQFAGNMCAVVTDLVDHLIYNMSMAADISKRPKKWRPTIYISGPITHDPDYKEKFHDAQVLLASCGFEVLNPAELVKVSDDKDYTDYLAEAVWHMLKADELYMLKGWSTSTGAKLELKLARLLGKKVNFA